ncbi:hypothetical protein [Beijerinckia sp. L45]|uniref:hypothetical protein n=1 Tax=Beijerinckia sp. L45 TaxID=1641855 RepID=UPI00131A71E5|nr:hypothetical protein [Beijerinckia sp. L45]
MSESMNGSNVSRKAQAYREGFCEGARAILKAIGDDLPGEQMRVLEKWVAGPLTAWRHADDDASPPPLPMIDGA